MLLMKIITTYYSISYIGLIYGKKDKIFICKRCCYYPPEGEDKFGVNLVYPPTFFKLKLFLKFYSKVTFEIQGD